MEIAPDYGDYGMHPYSIYKLTPGKKIEITSTLTDGSEDRCLKAFYFKPWDPYEYIPEFDQFASQLIANEDGSYSIDQSCIDEETDNIVVSGLDEMHCDYLELWDDEQEETYEFFVDSSGTFEIPSDDEYLYVFFYTKGMTAEEFELKFAFAVHDE